MMQHAGTAPLASERRSLAAIRSAHVTPLFGLIGPRPISTAGSAVQCVQLASGSIPRIRHFSTGLISRQASDSPSLSATPKPIWHTDIQAGSRWEAPISMSASLHAYKEPTWSIPAQLRGSAYVPLISDLSKRTGLPYNDLAAAVLIIHDAIGSQATLQAYFIFRYLGLGAAVLAWLEEVDSRLKTRWGGSQGAKSRGAQNDDGPLSLERQVLHVVGQWGMDLMLECL